MRSEQYRPKNPDPRGEDVAILIERYRPLALSMARKLIDHSQAEDAVQDSILIAMRSFQQLKDPDHFAAWFAAIVRNRCHRIRRSRWNEESVSDFNEMACALLAPPDPLAWSEVADAVGSLPEPLNQVVTLYYRYGYSVGELSTYLSLPPTTVKWQLCAARSILKRKLTYDHV